jgi:hypothetical protein
MILRGFTPNNIQKQLMVSERIHGNISPHVESLILYITPLTARIVTFAPFISNFTVFINNENKAICDFYSNIIYIRFINGVLNENVIESGYIPFTKEIDYEISTFTKVTDQVRFEIYNYEFLNIVYIINQNLLGMSSSFYETWYKPIFKKIIDIYNEAVK